MSTTAPLAAPTPMAGKGEPVDWMLAFKFNGASFPGCTADGVTPQPGTPGIFGGVVQSYPSGHSQQYVFASDKNPTLTKGDGCIGATLSDPLGATFAQVYNNRGYFYALWNDQFNYAPIASVDAPWGHSKGMLAWNDQGDAMLLQVTSPSWPGSGSEAFPRTAMTAPPKGDVPNTGNTLGAIGGDDDIEVSQHFFALKLTKDDLMAVLGALVNASVGTDTSQPSIVQNGGPTDVQALVSTLGTPSSATVCTVATLSSGARLVSKPSALHLPPWQLVSAELGGLPLRVASWWEGDEPIYSTDAGVEIDGWPDSLGKPGPVAIATSGSWSGTSIGLTGGEGDIHNHAKLGVSTDVSKPVCVFGDMNQEGALRAGYAYPGQTMASSQNGRGGTFYALQNQQLFSSLTQLLAGQTAPTSPPVPAPTALASP